MELIRRDADKKTRRMTWIVAAAIHIIIGVIFYQTPQGKAMRDAIVDVIAGKQPPPPPPPKPKLQQIKMQNPTAIKPKFDVKSQVKVDPKLNVNFKVMSSFDADASAPNFTSMAQSYSVKSFNLDKSAVSNVTTNILSVIGVGDIMSDKLGTKVVGIGKRMRAKLNLCLITTPGSTSGGTAVASKIQWDFIFRKYNSIERARVWLKENTQIQVTENTLTFPMDYTYSDWAYSLKKKGAVAIDSGSPYNESVAIARLEHAVEAPNRDPVNGIKDFIKFTKKAVFGYFRSKYEVEDAETLPLEMILKRVEERYILREWRKQGLTEILQIASSLKSNASQAELEQAVKPIYIFMRKAQLLENPIIIIANVVGLEKINEENMGMLRNYVKNGGFIWIDDTGVALGDINNQHQVARIFIHSLMSFDETEKLSEREQETFNALSKDDRSSQGFELGEPFPAFAHPQAFIPISISRDSPVDIRIFNRLNILVKIFSWTSQNPMKSGSYMKKGQALVWNCDNNQGEPVESGNFFIQMQAGLYQKTRIIRVSRLRMLDDKHPIMSVVHNFRNVPICTIDNGSATWESRPYGAAAFGYYLQGRMCLLYTEGSGVVAGLGDLSNTVAKDMASKFLNNVIAFCLSDEDGVAIRP
ncbi:MAG: hypothetical protein A2293_04885 [Elusimicrobia bacterium RIFOXYB2_FULL_49_7]|nr:MAG: hypothetical protein A2293_04885 [Elusimicrobia bacterium RIFOXYB2_FULL_49_7]